MPNLTYDPKKNRLYIRLKGTAASELEWVRSEIERIFPLLKPDFTVLTDLRLCGQFSLNDVPLIKIVQNRLWKLGVVKAARVVLDPEASASRSEVLNLVHGGYPASFATSVEAAEELLDRYIMWMHEQNSRREPYKFVDMDGWEDSRIFESFADAEKHLWSVRRKGRPNAIIINANIQIPQKK